MITQRGFTVWFTGLSRAGKTTISNRLHHRLKKRGVTNVEVLDGDDVTMHISKGLGFTKEDTDTNILRMGWVAQLLTKHNVPNLVSAISPYRGVRDEVRRMIEHAGGKGSFIEVYVECPVEVCAKRDTSGLYEKAKKGEVRHFTGIDEPYEPPHNPEVHIMADKKTPESAADEIMEYLEARELI